MRNVKPYGEQPNHRFPVPMSPPIVHTLYWCVADFDVAAVVKGELPTVAKKYMWASSFPGCSLWLWPDNPKAVDRRFLTRVWFLREEGEFLRPPVDSGMKPYIGLFTKWENASSTTEARRELGTLLLTPSANADDLDDYTAYLWDVGRIACDLLSKTDCALQVRRLADMGNPKLQEDACGFLKGELGEDCLPPTRASRSR